MSASEVVEIPGFHNFSEFSAQFHRQIQRVLEATQIVEGIFLGAWIDGLLGRSRVSKEEMNRHLDKIFNEVQNHGIAYLKLQEPGIDSHAWLISEMEKNADDTGYKCNIIDSNSPNLPWTLPLLYNQTHIEFPFIGDFGVPYLQRHSELQNIKHVISRYIDTTFTGVE